MPSVQFGISSYKRGRGDLPELPVINLFGEDAPTEDGHVVLQSRPGLSDRSAAMGAGPVTGLFQADGVLSGGVFGVSAGAFYSGTTLEGAVAGSGAVSITGNEIGVMLTAGTTAYTYDGTTYAAVAFPDSANVIKVITGAERFMAIRGGSAKFYWTEPLAATFDALNFATAESKPDQLLDGLFIDDTLILFGAQSVEWWPNTGDDTLPFQPLEGRVLEVGVKATGCATALGSSFAWVTNQNQVCVQDENTVISNPGLQKRIEASTECALFTFLLDGVEFLALRLDGETQVYNAKSGLWSEFQSYGADNWIPQCYAGGVFGSAVDGRTLTWNDAHEDAGGVLERRFRGGFPLNSGGLTISNVQLRMNVGQTPYLSGDYTDPQVEMRLSRDAGQTWGSWRGTPLGAQGNYRTRVQWRACGMASQPGFLAEFRVTAPVDVRFADVLLNEVYGGR